jgi:3-oxoacyl-(acyl-carrier-protein) synthase
LSSAKERGVPIEAEIRGFGMSMDGDTFDKQCLGTDGLKRAITEAMRSANVDSSTIDLIVWAPQGNVQDFKVIDSCKQLFAGRMDSLPLVTTTFNTGYIESASLLLSVAALLRTLKTKTGIWPQRSGSASIDSRKADATRFVLVAGSSDVGYNFAVLLDTAPEV